MIANNATLVIQTRGKGTYEVTQEIEDFVKKSSVKIGTVTVFVKHTSASLVIMENADPSARRDLEEYFENMLRKLKDLNYDQNQISKRKKLIF